MKNLIIALLLLFFLGIITSCSFTLHSAVKTNNTEEAKKYFEKNKPSFMDIYYAIINNNEILVQLIIDKGFNLNYSIIGFTPLGVAVQNNNNEMVKLLLKNGADVNIRPKGNSFFGYKPIYYAIKQNSVEIVKTFYEFGYDLNQKLDSTKSKFYTYPIVLSAEVGNVDILNYLIEKGVDFSVRNSNGKDALITGIEANNLEITNSLLQNGCPVNDISNDGLSPLMYAAEVNGINIGIIKSLIDKGADINFKDSKNHSAFSLACFYNNPDAALLLFEHGADCIISGDDFESNARKNHFLGDYYLAKDDTSSSRNNFIKANYYFKEALSNAKNKLFGINVNIVAGQILSVAAIVALGSVYAHVNSNYYANNSLVYNPMEGPLLYSQFYLQYFTIYQPTYSKSNILLYNYQLPASSSLEEKELFYETKIIQFKTTIALIDNILICFDKGLSKKELHKCIDEIQVDEIESIR